MVVHILQQLPQVLWNEIVELCLVGKGQQESPPPSLKKKKGTPWAYTNYTISHTENNVQHSHMVSNRK